MRGNEGMVILQRKTGASIGAASGNCDQVGQE
jgi:hypothetical protein